MTAHSVLNVRAALEWGNSELYKYYERNGLGYGTVQQEDKVCYTPLKDKCDAIRNLESPKTLRQTRAFCGMVNFLSSFLPNLHRLLILIYDLQKKAKKFKWTEEAEKAFIDIKKLLINPPVLKAPTPDGLF